MELGAWTLLSAALLASLLANSMESARSLQPYVGVASEQSDRVTNGSGAGATGTRTGEISQANPARATVLMNGKWKRILANFPDDFGRLRDAICEKLGKKKYPGTVTTGRDKATSTERTHK